MPYISKQEKIDLLAGSEISNAGQLNYSITKMLIEYIDTKGLKYQSINDVIGALEGAKAEFQRRVVNPYEDSKIDQNGDVY